MDVLTQISQDLQKGDTESVTKLVFERMQTERQVLVSQIESDGQRQASEIRLAADLESLARRFAESPLGLRMAAEKEIRREAVLAQFESRPVTTTVMAPRGT